MEAKEEKIKDLEKRLRRLSWLNLKQRIELEIIAEDPSGKPAGRIIRRYQRKIAQRKEICKKGENEG